MEGSLHLTLCPLNSVDTLYHREWDAGGWGGALKKWAAHLGG